MIKRVVSQPDKVVYYVQAQEANVPEFQNILLTLRGMDEYISRVDFYPVYCQNTTSFVIQLNDLGEVMSIVSHIDWAPGVDIPHGLATMFKKALATSPTPEPQSIPIHISYSGEITLHWNTTDIGNSFMIVFRIEKGKRIQ